MVLHRLLTAAARITAIVAVQMFFLAASALSVDLVGKTDATLNWTAATGPVFEYAVFVNRNGGGFPATPEQVVSSTSVTLTGAYGDTLVVRVAARDDVGNQGPVSLDSEVTNFLAPPPALNLSTSSLTATTPLGGSPANQTFAINTSGESTLEYSIATDASWLSVSPSSGTATTETDTITVSFATTALAAGSYSATITVSAVGLAAQTIAVSLSVSAAPGLLSLNKSSISTQVTMGSDALDQNFVISNIGGATVNYTVTASEAWLSVSPSSGTLSPSATQTITITFQTASFNPGVQSATITVTPSGSGGSPQQITVTVDVTDPLGAPGKPFLVLP